MKSGRIAGKDVLKPLPTLDWNRLDKRQGWQRLSGAGNSESALKGEADFASRRYFGNWKIVGRNVVGSS
jgi:hypothetical protein